MIEKMKKIKFSHQYDKMLNNPKEETPETAILLEVFRAKAEDLSEGFKEYDTRYYDEDGEEKQYPLPKGEVIILLLKSGDMLWTTIRRYIPRKHEYYLGLRGQEVENEAVKK